MDLLQLLVMQAGALAQAVGGWAGEVPGVLNRAGVTAIDMLALLQCIRIGEFVLLLLYRCHTFSPGPGP